MSWMIRHLFAAQVAVCTSSGLLFDVELMSDEVIVGVADSCLIVELIC